MNFQIKHQRGIVGNDLVVGIEAEAGELVARVESELDGFHLGTDDLEPPAVSYEREFPGVGDGRPHREHELKVTVTDPEGKTKIAFRKWVDPV
jgi:hypothetical protein